MFLKQPAQSKPFTRKFVITAAHCFCGTVVRCDGKDFQKIFNSDEEPLLEKVAVSVKYKGEGEDPIMHTVRRLIIHPDYYQTSGETVTGADSNEILFPCLWLVSCYQYCALIGWNWHFVHNFSGNTDVALIMTHTDVFEVCFYAILLSLFNSGWAVLETFDSLIDWIIHSLLKNER